MTTGYQIEALKKVRFYVEPNGYYAQDAQAYLTTSFSDLKATEATAELKLEQLDNETMQQRVDGMPPKINARKRGNLTLTSYLNGSGTAVSASVTPASFGLARVLETVMGGTQSVVGTGISSVYGPGGGMYTVDTATTLKAGSTVGLINSEGRLECTRIASKTGNSITTSIGQTFTPTSGSVMYGGTTCYLTQDPNKSLQFFVEGVNNYDKWNILGLQGGFGLKTEIGALPTIDFKFEGASWVTASGTNATDTLTEADYTDATPPPFVDGLVYVVQSSPNNTQGRGGMLPKDCYSFEFTPNITYMDVTSERGVNNIIRKRRNRSVPIGSGKFVIYETGGDAIDYQNIRIGTYNGGQNKIGGVQYIEVGFQVGTTPGNVVFIQMPQCQVTDVQRVDAGGLAGVEVSFDCHESSVNTPDSTSSADTDLAKSAFVISFH